MLKHAPTPDYLRGQADERAAIVKWLRLVADECSAAGNLRDADDHRTLARAIEAGEHTGNAHDE